MTKYKVTNNSNYPKSLAGESFDTGEQKELDLTDEQVEEALRGFEFEELEEESEGDSDEQEKKAEDGQESKSEDKEQEVN